MKKGQIPPYTAEFYGQQCQDKELNKKFRDLHHELVNRIISFCKENDIVIDDFSLSADHLVEQSIPTGKWQASTDSSFVFMKYSDDYKRAFWYMDRNFLKSLTKQELDKLEFNKEPFMYSM